MNKKIIILVVAVMVAYTVIGIVLYDLCSVQIVTVDAYSVDNEWVIDNINLPDGGTRYFCTMNDKGYKVGDKILVLHNKDELFQLNIISW